MNPKMAILRKRAMALPLLPGVYIMHSADGEIIYIGKAKALRNRVSQYFGSQNNHAEKVRRMVEMLTTLNTLSQTASLRRSFLSAV